MAKRFATLDSSRSLNAVLRVVGVGGGGCNAVDSMVARGLDGVEYIAVNTDAQALDRNPASSKIQIGTQLTKGLGAGADPKIGRKAAEEDKEKITEALKGSDMVFITTGMGGGTGTGAAPIIAEIAKSVGALVVGIVTKPFRWEGKLRMLNAERGIKELKQFVDSLIVIPNEKLLNVFDKNISAFAAFDKPNEVLYEATRGIADIITVGGLVNVDFADVRTVMNQSGIAVMGSGVASGENRALEAATKAISSPLLEGLSIRGAKSVLINITGSNNLTMNEIYEGNNVIFEAAGEEANVIFGCVEKEEMNDYISYTVIATGFDDPEGELSVPKQETRTKTPKWQPREEEPVEAEPFAPWNTQEIDENDLDVPTIFRVNKKEKANPLQGGFNFEDKEQEEETEEKKGKMDRKADDEVESSSFLRMIMD